MALRLLICSGVNETLKSKLKSVVSVGRPGFGEGAEEVEQDWTSSERDTASRTANRALAAIHDEVVRREQGLDFIEADEANYAGSAEAC